ncbi:MAG TPA: (2Fe-2S)-binding protein [Candidatus Limnocylindrales bacterium]|nr:(2Fe-2S)-binding protein [Candidatus Limnocylindrales bacterium]
MSATVTLTVNGQDEVLRTEPDETLLDALRRDLRLTSVREACGIGVCGSCTVLVDGRPVSACLLLAVLVDGRSIETVEGLADGETLHPIQQAFVDHSAFQCSFCTPGFLLATKALLEETPRPTPDEIRHYLAGNLCRCGSYRNIEEAVLDAARRLEA